MKFEPDKIYLIVVITKKYPTIFNFGERFKVLGKDIPTYCTEEDIKVLTKQEWNSHETLESIEDENKIEDEYATHGYKCYRCKLVTSKSDLDLHNGEWLCHECEAHG